MTRTFDPYREWLDIAPAEMPVDYYRLLGVPEFETDPERIRDAADDRMAHIRQFQNGRFSRSSQTILNQLSAARSCLLNPRLRRLYDAKLRRIRLEKKLPELSGPIELLPEERLPAGIDPFLGTGDMAADHDLLQPLKQRPVWPLILLGLLGLGVLVLVAWSLGVS